MILEEHNFERDDRMPSWEWRRSRIYTASKRYRRECGWDFAPGCNGIWILAFEKSKILGFLVLHDRDEDGFYESAAHVWVDPSKRRQGIGRSLMEYAREHYPLTIAEGWYTDMGLVFLQRTFPDLLPEDLRSEEAV
jgi:GNAT superfamily N-acetyltransferase